VRGQPMVMCAKTGRKDILKAILELGDFNTRPEGMSIDAQDRVYHRQYIADYEVESSEQVTKLSDRLRLNLFFDPIRRSIELLELEIALNWQEEALRELMDSKRAVDDIAAIKREYRYYKITCNPTTGVIESFEIDAIKVSKARSISGFFAIMTLGVDFDAMTAYRTYRLRDEQEKFFQQMKGQMAADRQRNWSEEGKTGRLFILFVSLILSSYVRYIWRSSNLSKLFSSSLEVLDEMRPIRLIEHMDKAPLITPFVGAQVDICEAFGFEIPEGCKPAYTSRQKPVPRRGRPRKKVTERDS